MRNFARQSGLNKNVSGRRSTRPGIGKKIQNAAAMGAQPARRLNAERHDSALRIARPEGFRTGGGIQLSRPRARQFDSEVLPNRNRRVERSTSYTRWQCLDDRIDISIMKVGR